MSRILLLISDPTNTEQICETLMADHELVRLTADKNVLPTPFDLALVDVAALARFGPALQAVKQTEQAVFLPVLLLTSQPFDAYSPDLTQSVNEMLHLPLQKAELKLRVTMLLQTHHLSVQLHQTNTLLQEEIKYHQQLETEREETNRRYRLVAEAIPQMVWTARPDGNVDYYNQRWYDYIGLSYQETKDWGWQTVLHPDDLQNCLERWTSSIETGELYEVEYRFRRFDGVYRWQLGRALPLLDEQGQIIAWFGTCTDIDDQKRAEEAERFLTDASKILATSLDYKATLKILAPTLVPMLGDGCFVDVVEPDGSFERVAAAHIISAKADLVRRLQQFPPDRNSDGIIMRAIKMRQTLISPRVPLEMLQKAVPDPEQLQVLQELDFETTMVVPLITRERTLGAISFARTVPNQPYTEDDQVVAEELAHRIALAIDNARLYYEAQAAIRRKDESLALLDTLLMSAPVGLAFFDNDLRFARVNQALAEINGLPVSKHLGYSIPEVLPDVGLSQVKLLQQVAATGEPLVNLEGSGYTPKSGKALSHWLASYYPVRTQAGEKLGIGAVVVDVTARKQAEEAQSFLVEASTLLSSSLDYQETLQNLARLAVSWLADWCVIDVLEENGNFQRLAAAHNDRTKDILIQNLRNYPPASNIPSSVLEVVQSMSSMLVPQMSEDMRITVAQNVEHLELMQSLGATSFMIVPLIARGRTLGAISLVISDQNRAYNQDDLILAEELAWRAALAVDNARLYEEAQRAIEAQKELDQLKDRFLSIASHELRTPLTTIKGFTQILKRELLKKQDVGNYERENRILENLLHQSDRMGELINEMLDISRLHSGQLELRYNAETDLVALIQRIVQAQQDATSHHTLILRTPPPAVVGSVDEARLEQVLNNLINNAIKYSPPDTEVEIDVSLPKPTEVLVAVRDYGYGINPDQQAHIFDQFYRARNDGNRQIDGLGLGLFISKEIIARHGGKLWVESELGKGSTFYFSLPLVNKAPTERVIN